MTFPSAEEWKAPWEEEGKDFDAELARTFAYNEKKRAHDFEQANKELKKSAREAAEAVKALESAEAERARAGESAAEKAEREAAARVEEVEAKNKELSETVKTNHLLKVQLETGLTERQASRLSGDNLEDLLADAKVFMEEAGLSVNEDTDEDGNPLHRQPAIKKAYNPGDPNPDAPKELSGLEIAAQLAAEDTGLFS